MNCARYSYLYNQHIECTISNNVSLQDVSSVLQVLYLALIMSEYCEAKQVIKYLKADPNPKLFSSEFFSDSKVKIIL